LRGIAALALHFAYLLALLSVCSSVKAHPTSTPAERRLGILPQYEVQGGTVYLLQGHPPTPLLSLEEAKYEGTPRFCAVDFAVVAGDVAGGPDGQVQGGTAAGNHVKTSQAAHKDGLPHRCPEGAGGEPSTRQQEPHLDHHISCLPGLAQSPFGGLGGVFPRDALIWISAGWHY